MALFTGVLILAIILPISLSIWQAARQAKMQFYRELDDYSNRIVVRTLQVADQAREALRHTPPPPVALSICSRSAGSPIPIATFRKCSGCVIPYRNAPPWKTIASRSPSPAGPHCPRRLSHLADLN
jgi:hypothetical protein